MKKIRNKPCPICNGPSIRIDRYDCYACEKCLIWLEDGCEDPECFFCANRPETPKDVNWEDKWNT